MNNPACPDYTAHAENAAEVLFPAGVPEVLTAEQSEAIDEMAEAEYRCCEGH
jgi:hypothetical protein